MATPMLIAADFVLPADQHAAIFERLCRCNADHARKQQIHPNGYIMDSYSSRSLGIPTRSYSGLPWNYDELVSTLPDLLGWTLGLIIELDHATNNLQVVGFHPARPIGQLLVFLEALAPYLPEGSFLLWYHPDTGTYTRDVVRNQDLLFETLTADEIRSLCEQPGAVAAQQCPTRHRQPAHPDEMMRHT